MPDKTPKIKLMGNPKKPNMQNVTRKNDGFVSCRAIFWVDNVNLEGWSRTYNDLVVVMGKNFLLPIKKYSYEKWVVSSDNLTSDRRVEFFRDGNGIAMKIGGAVKDDSFRLLYFFVLEFEKDGVLRKFAWSKEIRGYEYFNTEGRLRMRANELQQKYRGIVKSISVLKTSFIVNGKTILFPAMDDDVVPNPKPKDPKPKDPKPETPKPDSPKPKDTGNENSFVKFKDVIDTIKKFFYGKRKYIYEILGVIIILLFIKFC